MDNKYGSIVATSNTFLYRESVETTKGAVDALRIRLPTVDTLELDVRRNFLLLDALREGRKKTFSPTKKIKVSNH